MKQQVIVVGILVAMLAGPAVLGAQQSRVPADLDVEALLGALQRNGQSAPPPRQEETPAPESGGDTPTVRDIYESAWRAAARAARGVDLEDAWQALCQQLETSTMDMPQGDGEDISTLCRQYSMPHEEQVRNPAGKVAVPPVTAR